MAVLGAVALLQQQQPVLDQRGKEQTAVAALRLVNLLLAAVVVVGKARVYPEHQERPVRGVLAQVTLLVAPPSHTLEAAAAELLILPGARLAALVEAGQAVRHT
jgi:hypothetical protein